MSRSAGQRRGLVAPGGRVPLIVDWQTHAGQIRGHPSGKPVHDRGRFPADASRGHSIRRWPRPGGVQPGPSRRRATRPGLDGKSQGAIPGAIGGRCRATQGDAPRQSVQLNALQSDARRRTATHRRCLLSSGSRVRILPGALLPGAPGPRMFGVLRFWSGDVGVAHRRHIRCGAPALISADGPVRRRGFVGAALNLSSTICPFGHWCWPQGVFCGRVGRWALCVPPC